MTTFGELMQKLGSLQPVTEDTAEEFEETAAELAGFETTEAADALLDALDDACQLEGIMPSVAAIVAQLPPDILIPSLLERLPAVASRANASSRDLLRSILLNDAGRVALLGSVQTATPLQKAALRGLLERIAKYPRYQAVADEVLAQL